MSVKLIWATPDAGKLIAYMARVSNPNATPDDPSEKLVKYLIDHKHWSPLEMASVCVEIETTRDIARQILRHRSFHFQEFSQRYAEVDQQKPITREARLQDYKNRQNSIVTDDDFVQCEWQNHQEDVWFLTHALYEDAMVRLGIAKEQARALLPEGLTKTRMYMSGTIRDWYHYVEVRTDVGTQLEHRLIAEEIREILKQVVPEIFNVVI